MLEQLAHLRTSVTEKRKQLETIRLKRVLFATKGKQIFSWMSLKTTSASLALPLLWRRITCLEWWEELGYHGYWGKLNPWNGAQTCTIISGPFKA